VPVISVAVAGASEVDARVQSILSEGTMESGCSVLTVPGVVFEDSVAEVEVGVMSILSESNAVSVRFAPAASGADAEVESILSGSLIVSRLLPELERPSVTQKRAYWEGVVVVSERRLSA
jgi:hypothetical protein